MAIADFPRFAKVIAASVKTASSVPWTITDTLNRVINARKLYSAWCSTVNG